MYELGADRLLRRLFFHLKKVLRNRFKQVKLLTIWNAGFLSEGVLVAYGVCYLTR